VNGLPYYRAYPRDFFEGTFGMPFEVKGAYRMVLDLIYLHGGALPDVPDIAGKLGCSVRKWNLLREALMATGKLTFKNGIISNSRVDKEMIILGSYQDKQRENRSRPNKINGFQSPKHHHTEPDTDTLKKIEASPLKKKAARLPENWTIPPEWLSEAVAEGMAVSQAHREAERMKNWSMSSPSGAKLDWHAAWRNWYRKNLVNSATNNGSGTPRDVTINDAIESVRRQFHAEPVYTGNAGSVAERTATAIEYHAHPKGRG
jgi:uncharacterized protein YdaU (DUF1376 family)